jgi:hypothetical protein
VEYATFAEYLRKRLLWSSDVIRDVNREYSKSTQIVYFKPAQSFLDHEYGPALLRKLLKSGRAK